MRKAKPLTFLSLFAGIGMHDLGLERAGFRVVGQVEWEPFCSAVLEKHWPNVPRWSDVRHASVESIRERCGHIDCISGGFSCRDISVAGKGRGIGKETESGITWRNMFRIIRGIRPAWLIIENVPRLRTLAADRVLAALERIGYACWPVVVGAEHVGAPHRRHRVWIVGCLGDSCCAASERNTGRFHQAKAGERSTREQDGNLSIGPESPSSGGGTRRTLDEPAGARRAGNPERLSSRAIWHKTWRQELARSGRISATVADASGAGLEIGRACAGGAIAQLAMPSSGSGNRWPARPGEPQHEWEHPRLSNPHSESLGGFTEPRQERREGTAQSEMGGAASRHARRLAGFARRSSLKALGNGNPPQCAEAIGRAVMHLASLSPAPSPSTEARKE